jgi:hypothetical protein
MNAKSLRKGKIRARKGGTVDAPKISGSSRILRPLEDWMSFLRKKDEPLQIEKII